MSLPNLSKLAKTATVYINERTFDELQGEHGYYYRMKGVEDDMIDARLEIMFEKAKNRTMDNLVEILSTFDPETNNLDDLSKYQSSLWVPTVGDCKVFISGNWRLYDNKLWVDLSSVHAFSQVHEESLLAEECEPIPGMEPFQAIIGIYEYGTIQNPPDPQKTFEDTVKDLMRNLKMERGLVKGSTHSKVEAWIKQNYQYQRSFKQLENNTIAQVHHALKESREKMHALDARHGEMQKISDDALMQVESEIIFGQACRSGLLDGTNKSLSTGAMSMIMHHHGSHMQLSHKKSSHQESYSTMEFPHIGDKVDVFICNKDETGSKFPMQDRADVTRALHGVLDLLHGASSNKRCIAVYGVDMNPEKRMFPGETLFRAAGRCLLYLVVNGKVVDMLTAVVAVNDPPHKIFSVQSIFHTNFGISKAINYWKAVEDFTYKWFEF